MTVKEECEKAGLKLNIKKKITNNNKKTLALWHLAPSLHGKQKGKM